MKKIGLIILICGLLIICTGCITKSSEKQGYEAQERIITGTIDHVRWNMVGQHYVHLDDGKILQFDIGNRLVDIDGTVITANETQLESLEYLRKGDYCQWRIERYTNIYYPYEDTPWVLIDFRIIKKS